MSLISYYRSELGMTQKEFAHEFSIPIGTVRNWEQGISSPPSYVFNMLERIIWRDSMINTETLKLMVIIKELADKTKNGYQAFKPNLVKGKDVNDSEKIIYDMSTMVDGSAKIVLDMAFDVDCIDVVSYYDNLLSSEQAEIRYRNEDDYEWVEVKVKDGRKDFFITIDDGSYYYVE